MKTKWAILLLILAGFIAYGNTLKNGLFWDDDEFITRNEYIRSFRYLPQWFSQPLTAGAGVNSNYYRPLLMASFTIDYHLWGLWPAGYHFENILWHTTAAIFLYFFLKDLLLKFSIQYSVFSISAPVAFATALLWLVHPVHVEAVAYANSRGDSIATVFILLTLILWINNKIKASAITFILALLSKEFAIVTPGLILLIELIINSKHEARNSKQHQNSNVRNFSLFRVSDFGFRILTKLLPHIIIASIYIFLRLTVFNFQNTLNFYGVDLTKVNQQQPLTIYATSLPVRLMTFLKVLPIYAGILIWPSDLHMERTVEISTSFYDLTVISVVGLLILIGLLSYWLFAIHKNRLPTFALGWFFISIVPVSGLIPISQILAEHFLYLPSIGFFLLISWFLVSVFLLLPPSPRFRFTTFFSLITLISLILTSKTISQNRIWRDPITFYEYTLSKTTPTARVYNNLAMAYADAKNHDQAIDNYQKSIALGDVYPNPHYNLGNTYIEIGETEKAEDEYKKALKIDPGFHYATLKLGQIYINQGKIGDAKKLVCPVFPTQPLCL